MSSFSEAEGGQGNKPRSMSSLPQLDSNEFNDEIKAHRSKGN